MVYTIKIEGMEFRAAHGCYETEQRVGGNFVVDVALDIDDDGAVEADDISRTVNYVEVYEIIRRQMAEPSKIIENVAHRIAKTIYAHFAQIVRVEVSVAKLAPPIAGKIARVSATLVR